MWRITIGRYKTKFYQSKETFNRLWKYHSIGMSGKYDDLVGAKLNTDGEWEILCWHVESKHKSWIHQ